MFPYLSLSLIYLLLSLSFSFLSFSVSLSFFLLPYLSFSLSFSILLSPISLSHISLLLSLLTLFFVFSLLSLFFTLLSFSFFYLPLYLPPSLPPLPTSSLSPCCIFLSQQSRVTFLFLYCFSVSCFPSFTFLNIPSPTLFISVFNSVSLPSLSASIIVSHPGNLFIILKWTERLYRVSIKSFPVTVSRRTAKN